MLTDDGRLKVWNIYNRGMKTGFFATEEHIPSPWHENSIHCSFFESNQWLVSVFSSDCSQDSLWIVLHDREFWIFERMGESMMWVFHSRFPWVRLACFIFQNEGRKKIQRQSKNFGDPENKASLNSWASESTTKINYFFHTEVEQTNMMRRSCSDGDGEPNNYQESIIPSNEAP